MSLVISMLGAFGIVLLFSGVTRARVVSAPRSPLVWLDQLAEEAGYRKIGGAGTLGVCLVGAVGGFMTANLASPLVPLSVICSIAGGAFPLIRARARRDAHRNGLRHAWPDALADIISGVRAGLSLAECCCALAYRGPHEMRQGFAAFASTYAASGSFDAGLSRLRDLLADPIADRVVAILRIAHEVGGNDLVRVLRTSSDLIRDDLRIRGEIRARWSWTITAARLAAAAPFVVLVIMGVRPEAAAAYTSAGGTVTISVGTVATFVGYRFMLRAGRLPEQRRIR